MTTSARPRLRRTVAASALAASVTVLTACGSSTTAASVPDDATAAPTVETAFGPVEVPADPQRVVALGDTPLDTSLALGVTPVGTLSSRGGTTVSAYLADRAGEVPLVGTVRETNLEAVVQADPDLILAAAGTESAQYQALSAIAPTVVPEVTGFGEWESDAAVYAEALGQEGQVQDLLDQLDERADEIASRIDDPGTVAVVRWMPNGPIVMSGGLMAGRLVEESGEELLPVADFSDKPHTDPLSLENLAGIDADVVYVATLNADGEQALAAAQASPAFARLRATQNDRVFTVEGSTWTSAAGPIAASLVLDDVERIRTSG